MSIQKRRITYWSIDFINCEEHSFDQALFCRFMKYVAGLDEMTRLEKNTKTNKAISLESVNDETKQGVHLLKVVFKSCKFNHAPAYMSSSDGTERPSAKHLDEGEKELTHICMKIDTNEAFPDVLTEEKQYKKLSNLLQQMKRDGIVGVRGYAVHAEWFLVETV